MEFKPRKLSVEINVHVVENGKTILGGSTHTVTLPEAKSFQGMMNFLGENQSVCADFAKSCANAGIWEAADLLRREQEAVIQANESETADQEPDKAH